MAAGIVDCTGNVIKRGDWVKHKPSGAIFRVCGGAVNTDRMYNSEECEVLDPATSPVSTPGAAGSGSDCVVWGD